MEHLHTIETLLQHEFPIGSQTSATDRLTLLTIKNLLTAGGSYKYCEIGSFLGGSLTPFLRDNNCSDLLSIDERNRQQPDERGAKFDYNGITHQTMVDNLLLHHMDVGKLRGFDGSVDKFPDNGIRFDGLFIDGEHTDYACFRDFIHGLKLMAADSIIAFHDSDLIYKALRMIQEFLLSQNTKFTFVKIKDSAMSVVLLGKYTDISPDKFFNVDHDLEGFYKTSEDNLLLSLIQQRFSLSVNYTLRETPIYKAY